MKSIWKKYKLSHFLFWIVYGGAWVAVSYDARNMLWQTLVLNIFFLLAHISAAYTSIYILVPRFLNKNKPLSFLGVSLLNILFNAAFIALGFYVTYAPYPEALHAVMKMQVLFPACFLSVSMTVMIVTMIKLAKNRILGERRAKALEKAKLEAELSFLKAQINPHFLFNAINNIYFLINKDASLAADSLLAFSDMLRYQIYDCNAEKVALQSELAHLRNYIQVKRLSHQAIDINFETDVQEDNLQISPLLLMPFVENAFKHLGSHGGKTYIHIRIKKEENCLLFEIVNSLGIRKEDSTAGGVGLENVRRRLNLLYPGLYSLEIHEGKEEYKALLKMQLLQNEVHNSR